MHSTWTKRALNQCCPSVKRPMQQNQPRSKTFSGQNNDLLFNGNLQNDGFRRQANLVIAGLQTQF